MFGYQSGSLLPSNTLCNTSLSAGGERSRRRKHAEAQRARKEASRDAAARQEYEDDESVPKLFSFMNRSLGDGSEAAAVHRRAAGADASAPSRLLD